MATPDEPQNHSREFSLQQAIDFRTPDAGPTDAGPTRRNADSFVIGILAVGAAAAAQLPFVFVETGEAAVGALARALPFLLVPFLLVPFLGAYLAYKRRFGWRHMLVAAAALTANKVAAVDANLLLFAHFAVSVGGYIAYLTGRRKFAIIGRSVARFVPLYTIWFAVVASVFPWFFVMA